MPGDDEHPENAFMRMEEEPVSGLGAKVATLARKLKALETHLWESRTSNEKIQERLVQTLEALESRIESGQQATAARLETAISSLGTAINELKGVIRTEAKNTEETVWRGLGQLEAKVSKTGAESQHRLARAVATLSIAADEWRAAAPNLTGKAEESVVESLLALDAAVARGSQSIGQYLERSMVELAGSLNSWKAELEASSRRSQERVSSGLNSLEKRTNDQMKDLEARIEERQMAIITLIIGGGGAAPAPAGLDWTSASEKNPENDL